MQKLWQQLKIPSRFQRRGRRRPAWQFPLQLLRRLHLLSSNPLPLKDPSQGPALLEGQL